MSICPHLKPENCIGSLQQKFIYKDQCTKCFADYVLFFIKINNLKIIKE